MKNPRKDTVSSLAESFTNSERNISSSERALSLAFAASMLGFGVFRRDALGIASALLSIPLWDRGVRGHCAVSAMIGRNTAEPPEKLRKRFQRTYAITVDKPYEDVYRYLTDRQVIETVVEGGKIPELPAEATSFSRVGPHHHDGYGELEIAPYGDNWIEWRRSEVAGLIELRKAPGDRGTEIRARLRAQKPSRWIDRFAYYVESHKLRRGLRQLKQVLESGDAPTIVGQPSGRAGERDLSGTITIAEVFTLS